MISERYLSEILETVLKLKGTANPTATASKDRMFVKKFDRGLKWHMRLKKCFVNSEKITNSRRITADIIMDQQTLLFTHLLKYPIIKYSFKWFYSPLLIDYIPL